MYLLHHQFKNDLRLDLSFFHITQCKLHHFFKNILVINDSCLKIQFYKIDTIFQKFGIEISHITQCILHHFSQLFKNVLVLQPCMERKCLVALNMIGLDVVASCKIWSMHLIHHQFKNVLVLQSCMETKCFLALNMIGCKYSIVAAMQQTDGVCT